MRLLASSTFVRRSAIAASVLAVSVAAFGPTASASITHKHPTINTVRSWDGAADIVPFGCPDTTTYGETITIPAGKTSISKFVFKWTDLDSGSMVVRGEVYAWDGTKATGSAVAESAPKTVTSPHTGFYSEAFRVSGAVTAGQQYVIFASIDKDYESCTNNYQTGWGAIFDDSTYPGGTFVFQNNSGDESQWTSTPWSDGFAADLAFKAFLS